jgi:hypothetical protein
MKMNFESQPNNEPKKQEGLPPIDQGELVMQGVLADYYEKIMQLKEDLINAGPAEKEELEREIMELQKNMDKGSDVIASTKEFPNNDNVIEISDEDDERMAA